jgi:rRNA small subunit methyltransferase G
MFLALGVNVPSARAREEFPRVGARVRGMTATGGGAAARPEAPAILRVVASRLDCPLSDAEERALLEFWRVFAAWNDRINLGGARSFETLVTAHLVDAFAARRFIGPGDLVLDVGSGGGLPAIPLAILCPDSRFELWEPRAKRAAFLRAASRELGLRPRVEVRMQRLEIPPTRGAGADPGAGLGAGLGGNAGEDVFQAFTVAMSRATWPPAEWLARARAVAPRCRVLVFTNAAGAATLQPPSELVSYAKDRRLCLFLPGTGVPRETGP